MKRTYWFSVLILPSLLALAAEPTIEFNRDVRPIISEKCYFCHGPDQNDRKSDLRLDTFEGAREVIASGELLARIQHGDPDEVMPPPKANQALTAAEIETMKQWIAEGATYQEHWAYAAAVRPDVPEGVHPVDHFVDSGLAAQNIAPSPSAPPEVLARRLSLDLLGLPPEPESVAQFVKDSSPDKWQKLVEATLSSPHYGERMAVYWLDLVRYADTVGYHGDQNMAVSPYRDYVIKAFNDNMPFDQFTREQLGGDLLENPTEWQMIASAYNRLNKKTNEGGAQALEYQVKNAGDRVRTTSTVWLGGTLGCAECHDHKFDPYSQKDFYTFAAYFADVEDRGYWGRNGHSDGIWGASMKILTDEQRAEKTAIEERLAAVKVAINGKPEGYEAAYDESLAALRDLVDNKTSAWSVQTLTNLHSSGGATMKDLGDGSWLSTGKNPDDDTYRFTLTPGKQPMTAFLLDVLKHDSLTRKSVGRGNGNVVLSSVEAKTKSGKAVKIVDAKASFEQGGWPVKNALNSNKGNGWALAGHEQPKDASAWFCFETPVNEPVDIYLRHESPHKKHVIGRFRISTTANPQPNLSGQSYSAELAAAVQAETPDNKQRSLLKDYVSATSPLFAELRQERDSLETKVAAHKNMGRTVLVTQTAAKPREVRILNRGNWMDTTGELVAPATPHFLSALSDLPEQQSRLDLADWLVSKDNPLTARVYVNRLWKLMFGTGLSKVLDDLGSQGEVPTHPELLDWLAVEFIESGWDMKHMVALVVSSETYRRASVARPDLAEVDPYNRLLAMQTPVRLDAEMVRDNALAISGLLVRDIGGDSAHPYQPDGYYRELNFPRRKYAPAMDQNQYRRGLYTHWQRSFLHPMLKAFDAPDREECTANRERSNTPTQSLVLLNDPTFVEAARVFAQTLLQRDGDLRSKLDWAFQRTVSRPARDAELALLTAYYEDEHAHYSKDPEAAKALIQMGLAPQAPDLNPVDLAAMTCVSRAILNLHESITRY